MSKIIADISSNSPTASSRDRYKYRYGYTRNGSQHDEREMNVYRRPVTKKKDANPEIDKVRNNVKNQDDEGGCVNYSINIISNKFNVLNTICDKIDSIIAKRPTFINYYTNDLQGEEHEEREIYRNSMKKEIEKEKNCDEEKKEEKINMKAIHKTLGKIIYHSRSGEIFVAEHSTQLHVYSDKHHNQFTTQKVIWNDRIFQTKQDWFSEMAKMSAARKHTNMQIVRCI